VEGDELEVTACHEAGHAVLAWVCGIDISWASMVPKPNSNGSTQTGCSVGQLENLRDGDPTLFRLAVLADTGGIAADIVHQRRTTRPASGGSMQGIHRRFWAILRD
jgi:hypothetical protein